MHIDAAQKLHGQTSVSRQATVKQYPPSTSISRQTDARATATEVAAVDRIELSASPRYIANRIFETVAERVAAEFGVDAADQIQFNPRLNPAPEATAERIFAFAMGFDSPYREQQTDADEAQVRGRFMSMIRGAINRGMAESRGILSGLSGFTPAIEEVITETHQRLQKMLNGFEATQLQAMSDIGEASAVEGLFPPFETSAPLSGEASLPLR